MVINEFNDGGNVWLEPALIKIIIDIASVWKCHNAALVLLEWVDQWIRELLTAEVYDGLSTGASAAARWFIVEQRSVYNIGLGRYDDSKA